ncbi:MAG: FeoA family protein [Halobacteriota archaeon]
MGDECVSNHIAEEKRAFLNDNYGDTMPLNQLKPGELGRVMAVEGGRGIRQKLFLRGLFEGSVVRMISCYGPVTIELDRNMMSIGRGMAQKVIVRRI